VGVPLLDECDYSMKSGLTTILALHQGSWKYHMRITGGKDLLEQLLLHINFSFFFLASGI